MAYLATTGYRWMQCAANATSYPGNENVAGNRTTTAGDSVTENSTRVLIGSITLTSLAIGTISIQNHAGTLTYLVYNQMSATVPGNPFEGPIEIPSGFRVVSSVAALDAIITYLPLT